MLSPLPKIDGSAECRNDIHDVSSFPLYSVVSGDNATSERQNCKIERLFDLGIHAFAMHVCHKDDMIIKKTCETYRELNVVVRQRDMVAWVVKIFSGEPGNLGRAFLQ